MAKIGGGFRALFGGAQVENILGQFQDKVDSKALEVLQYTGELFVNEARIKGNYNDRTGNLRSSIGYIILNDGKVIDKNFQKSGVGSGGNKGVSAAKEFTDKLAQQYSSGLVLIGVAGMEYAAYVEKKHSLDVISGSAPESEFIKNIFSEIKF